MKFRYQCNIRMRFEHGPFTPYMCNVEGEGIEDISFVLDRAEKLMMREYPTAVEIICFQARVVTADEERYKLWDMIHWIELEKYSRAISLHSKSHIR